MPAAPYLCPVPSPVPIALPTLVRSGPVTCLTTRVVVVIHRDAIIPLRLRRCRTFSSHCRGAIEILIRTVAPVIIHRATTVRIVSSRVVSRRRWHWATHGGRICIGIGVEILPPPSTLVLGIPPKFLARWCHRRLLLLLVRAPIAVLLHNQSARIRPFITLTATIRSQLTRGEGGG